MKSAIGITTFIDPRPRADYDSVSDNYVYSVSAGGSLPLLLPAIRDAGDYGPYLDRIDGLLFTGGGDVSPLRYGEALSPKTPSFSSLRDEWEIGLCLAAYERGMPILAICRGHQLVNVALGGTLYQDLPSQLPAASSHSSELAVDELSHYVDIEDESSRLYAMFGKRRVLTNSFHHQAVRDLAPCLKPTAAALDGVNEGYESKEGGRFLVGVQFHPECLTKRYPEFVSIFAALARAAEAYHLAK